MIPNDIPVYKSCIDGKITKKPFITKRHRTKECLELMNTDVYRTFGVHTQTGYGYFITFIDKCSRFGYVYLVHKKFNALDKFIEFKEESDNLLCKHIKEVQLDRSGEFVSSRFDSIFREHEIIFQLSAPRTPLQNRVMEIRNQTLMNIVRLMMCFSSLPTSIWGYA